MQDAFILITGATSEIGKAISKELSSSYRLILHGRNPDRLNTVKAQCNYPLRHLTWQYDFTHIDTLFNDLKIFLKEEGVAISKLIHCAGATKILPIKNFELKYSKEIFNINFFSVTEIIRALLKKNINNCVLSDILFISGLWSKFGDKGNSVYASSKGALDSFVKTLAVELGPETKVNSILPGAIRTPMSERVFNNPEILEKVQRDYILGVGNPEDVSNLVRFLISEQARWMTGQNIILDGGKSAH